MSGRPELKMNISRGETLNEMKMRWEQQSTDEKMEEPDEPGVTGQIYLFIYRRSLTLVSHNVFES